MHIILKSALVAAAIFSTVPAMAQTFSGARIEGYGGFDRVRGKVSSGGGSVSEHTSGAVYGVGIGYDYPVGDGWIVGLQGNIDFADNKKCATIFGSDEGCFKVRRNYEIGGRVGRDLTGGVMMYVSAGYVNGKARVTYVDQVDPTNNFTISESKGGLRGAVGAEFAFTRNVYAKVEYRYTDYNDYKASAGTLGFNRHQFLGGIGFRM